MNSPAIREFTVPPHLDGARLDRAAAELASGMSRARLKRAIDAGAVRVNGRRRAKGETVAQGDVIAIDTSQIAEPDGPAVATPDAPLTVRFEGEGVLVVEKPAGQATAPLLSGETGALANALVGRYPELAGVGYSPREPGLVHRLDTDTSGLVLVARSASAFATLRDALKADFIEKRYLLVCASDGLPDRGTIEIPIANHPKDQRRVYPCIHPRDVMRYAPRPATTRYEVLRRAGAWAIVEATIARALRHQIRAHFAAIGHPLAADVLYGAEPIPAIGRHALHASRIAYDGAPGVAAFDVASELPAPLASLLA